MMLQASIRKGGMMGKDEQIFDVIKNLAQTRGNIIPLLLIYRSIIKRGIYTSKGNIHNALKRLEICGKIRAAALDSIELIEV